MSNSVFPTLPGLSWGVIKRPRFSTIVQKTASGKEIRSALMSYPLWEFQLSFEVLRGSNGYSEMQTLAGFFNSMLGSYDTFLFNDLTDNSVTAQSFGTGNGITAAFQLVRPLGGFSEPVQNVNGAPAVYLNNGWQGNQLQYSTPRTNVLPDSVNFSAWNLFGTGTATANAGTAPDGTTTATLLADNDTANIVYFDNIVTVTSDSNTWTFSVFLKQGTAARTSIVTYLLGGSTPEAGGYYTDITWSTMTLQTNCAGVITSVGGGWYRLQCSITNNNTGNTSLYSRISPAGMLSTASATGTVYAWGAQTEKSNNVATTYIPTTTSAVTVTDYTLGSTGIVTYAAAPTSGAAMTWTGNYYFRCRFMQDLAEFNQFMQSLWEMKKLEFVSVKL